MCCYCVSTDSLHDKPASRVVQLLHTLVSVMKSSVAELLISHTFQRKRYITIERIFIMYALGPFSSHIQTVVVQNEKWFAVNMVQTSNA